MSTPPCPPDDQQVLTYVLPDEPDTLYLLPGTAQDQVPDGAIQGLAFSAGDLCREVVNTREVIRALVICGVRFEQRQTGGEFSEGALRVETEVHGPADGLQDGAGEEAPP